MIQPIKSIADNLNLRIAPKFTGIKTNKLERSPQKDTVNFTGAVHKKLDLSPEMKDMLDNKVFEFEKTNGEIYKGTIRGYLYDSLVGYNNIPQHSIVHCTPTKENVDKIMRNGLDWTKTSRMKCGPGTYFSVCMSASMEYGTGSNAVYAKYKGNQDKYPVFENSFYDAINYNGDLADSIEEIDSKANTSKVIDQYCHEILCDEMGIDMLYAGTGRAGGAFVVLNDNCMRLSRTDSLY